MTAVSGDEATASDNSLEAGAADVVRVTDYIVGPLASALDIMLEFEGGEPELRASDLARRVGITRNKAFRLIKTLESRGFLQRVGDQYRVGIRLLTLGQLAAKPVEVLQAAAQPELEALREETGETVYVLSADGDEAVCIASIESAHYLRIAVSVGLRRPLHAGAGQKMLLAGLDDQRVAQFLNRMGKALTASTIIDQAQLRAELEEIRQRGYSLSFGEVESDAGAVAAPIRDHSGQVVAALVVGGAISRVVDHLNGSWPLMVAAAAERISTRLGFERTG
jgi:DNA-binding IclR family transcriptional regulator